MAAEAPRSFTESVPTNQKNSRRRPLHTCGVSFIALGQIAFSKSQALNGWIGSILRLMVVLARPFTPLASIMQYLFLAELSLIDKFIVATKKIIEVLFPPSTHLFSTINKLICVIEALPSLLKDAKNKFPMIIHQSPLPEYVLVHLISWLKIFLSSLTSENGREKEITVDVSYQVMPEDLASVNDLHGFVESPIHAKTGTLEKFPLPSDPSSETETEADGPSPKQYDSKQGYDEAVEEETQENVVEMGTEEKEETQEKVAEKGTEEKEETKEKVAEKWTEENEETQEKVAEKGTEEKDVTEKAVAEKGTDEKDDTEKGTGEMEVAGKGTHEKEAPEKETQETEVAMVGTLEKGTEEKEAVEKVSEEKEVTKTGTDEKDENREGSAVEEVTTEIKIDATLVKAGKVEEVEKDSKSDKTEDSILDLFESTWHLRPPKKR